jgi:hypothetical protein
MLMQDGVTKEDINKPKATGAALNQGVTHNRWGAAPTATRQLAIRGTGSQGRLRCRKISDATTPNGGRLQLDGMNGERNAECSATTTTIKPLR